MDDIDGAIVDQRLEPFLQPETVLAGEQRRAGVSLDFLEVLPSPEAAGVEQVFQPGEAVLLERLGGANAVGTVPQRRLEASTESGLSQPMASRTAAINSAPYSSPLSVGTPSVSR
jgi:hypothetical protein